MRRGMEEEDPASPPPPNKTQKKRGFQLSVDRGGGEDAPLRS